MPFIIGGIIAGVGALGGGLLSANAAQSAAGTQADAAKYGATLSNQQFLQTQSNLAPWLGSGQTALSELQFGLGLPGTPTTTPQPQQSQFMMPGGPGPVGGPSQYGVPGVGGPYRPGDVAGGQIPNVQAYQVALAQWQAQQGQTGQVPTGPGAGSLLKPFTLADFQQSPGYQFNLQQGQLAIDKAASARGNYYAPQTLQDTAKFSQGLASNEFLNAYNMYNQNQSNVYNRLYSQSGTGQNAAAQIGAFGAQATGAQANLLGSAAAAQAAGTVGSANAIGQGIGGAAGGVYNAWLMSQILGQQQQGIGGIYPQMQVLGQPSSNYSYGQSFG